MCIRTCKFAYSYASNISRNQPKGLDSLVTSKENNKPAGVHGWEGDSVYGFLYLLNFDPGECILLMQKPRTKYKSMLSEQHADRRRKAVLKHTGPFPSRDPSLGLSFLIIQTTGLAALISEGIPVYQWGHSGTQAS